MPARRKSQHLKVLQGTDRKDRARVEMELPPAESIERPDWLAGPEAVAEWDRLVVLLQDARVLTDGDLMALGHLCNLHAACVKLYRAQMEPTAAQLTQLRLLLAEFGLSPASRSKAGVVKAGDVENVFDKLKRKRGA